MLLAVFHNVGHGSVSEHHALGVSGRAGGVVDDGYGMEIYLIGYLGGLEVRDLPLVPGFHNLIAFAPKEFLFLHAYHAADLGEGLVAELVPEFRVR